MPNLITAGGASDPLALSAASDGALTFQTGPSGAKVNAVSFAADGTPTFLKSTLVADPANAVGYGTGAGGTVTQATSRTTSVTINKPTGSITMFTAAGSTTWSGFFVNNSLVGANDTVILSLKGGNSGQFYTFQVGAVSAGLFQINFLSSGTNSDAPVINFAIIKGAVS